MRAIPPAHRREISNDEFFKKCVVCGSHKVQIHHNFIYAGKQISELWNYVPLCEEHHDKITPHKPGYDPLEREYIDWFVLIRMKPEDRAKYPKKDWAQLKKYLDTKFLPPYAVSRMSQHH